MTITIIITISNMTIFISHVFYSSDGEKPTSQLCRTESPLRAAVISVSIASTWKQHSRGPTFFPVITSVFFFGNSICKSTHLDANSPTKVSNNLELDRPDRVSFYWNRRPNQGEHLQRLFNGKRYVIERITSVTENYINYFGEHSQDKHQNTLRSEKPLKYFYQFKCWWRYIQTVVYRANLQFPGILWANHRCCLSRREYIWMSIAFSNYRFIWKKTAVPIRTIFRSEIKNHFLYSPGK